MNLGILRSFDITKSALNAERLRLKAATENIANRKTTHTEDGGYYKTQEVIQRFVEEKTEASAKMKPTLRTARHGHIPFPQSQRAKFTPGGVESEMQKRNDAPLRVFDPEHPDAGEDGYVLYPEIDTAREMTRAISALRAYEANVTSMEAAKKMFAKALEI